MQHSVDMGINTDQTFNYSADLLTEFFWNASPPSYFKGWCTYRVVMRLGSAKTLQQHKSSGAIKVLRWNGIKATIVTGCAEGETVFIPHIQVILSDFPFELKSL